MAALAGLVEEALDYYCISGGAFGPFSMLTGCFAEVHQALCLLIWTE